MREWCRWLMVLILIPTLTQAAEPSFGQRLEVTHPGHGHTVHISAPAVAVGRDGEVLLAWAAQEGRETNLYLVRGSTEGMLAVRVSPEGMAVDSLHQPPGLATGPNGEVYLSWSSAKAKPEGVLFASDLRLSRSLDGGQSFDTHLRVNDDRPISHSFEGLAVAEDGTVVLAWIDSRHGWDKAATYMARITGQGRRVEHVQKLDGETCVCCRVDVTTGPRDTVAAMWRKVFPDNIRDMVLDVSRDGGRTFGTPSLVHADRWRIAACPHRGGSVRVDDAGRFYLVWYTEGAQDQPRLLFTVSPDGRHFVPPQRLDASVGSIPDHLHLAVDGRGRAAIVWEDSTAVRRRVLLRLTADAGEHLSLIRPLSTAIKAYAPAVTVSPTGEFVVAWHEEQFPVTKTIIQSIRLDGSP